MTWEPKESFIDHHEDGSITPNDMWLEFVNSDTSEDFHSIWDSLSKWSENQLWDLARDFSVPVQHGSSKEELLTTLTNFQLQAHATEGIFYILPLLKKEHPPIPLGTTRTSIDHQTVISLQDNPMRLIEWLQSEGLIAGTKQNIPYPSPFTLHFLPFTLHSSNNKDKRTCRCSNDMHLECTQHFKEDQIQWRCSRCRNTHSVRDGSRFHGNLSIANQLHLMIDYLATAKGTSPFTFHLPPSLCLPLHLSFTIHP